MSDPERMRRRRKVTIDRRNFGRVFRRTGRDGKAVGAYVIRYRTKGKEVQITVGSPAATDADLREATARLADLQSAMNRDIHKHLRPVAKASIEEFWSLSRDVFRARVSDGHFANLDGMVATAGEYFTGRKMRDLEAPDIEDFLAHLSTTGGGKTEEGEEKGRSAATCNRYRAALSALFREATRRGFAHGNPVDEVIQRTEELRPVPFLSAEDLERIAAAAPPWMRPAVVLAGETGLRRGEIGALSWRDVDLGRGSLTVRRSKNGTPREVPLTPRARAVLEETRAGRGAIPLVGADPVLPDLQGRGLGRLSEEFGDVATKAGFEGLRFHDLRHGFASALAAAGVPIPTVGQLLGHRSIRTTMRYASHSPADAGWKAIAALASSRGETAAPAKAQAERRGA